MAHVKRGRNLMVFADGKAIALATNHTLTISPSILEDRTKDDGDQPVAEFDTYTWGITTDSIVGKNPIDEELTIVALIDKMLAMQSIDVAFDTTSTLGALPSTGWAPDEGISYPYTTGTAWIESISISAGSTGYATANISFKGQGKLS